MKRRIIALLLAAFSALGASVASAATISLYEGFAQSDASSFTDALTGSTFGSYTFSYNTAGAHYGGLYLDYEINESDNTFFNEYGATGGTAPAGLTWEIDEPGFDSTYTGDIYGNFFSRTLDGKIFDGTFNGPQDVSMALLYNFTLSPGQTADLTFTVGQILPSDVFYLAHLDGPDGEDPLYFYAQLRTGSEEVPEPSTFLLLGAGLAGLGLYRRRCRR